MVKTAVMYRKRILDVTHLKIEFKKGKIFFDKAHLAHFVWLKAFAQPETTADLKLFSAFLFSVMVSNEI